MLGGEGKGVGRDAGRGAGARGLHLLILGRIVGLWLTSHHLLPANHPSHGEGSDENHQKKGNVRKIGHKPLICSHHGSESLKKNRYQDCNISVKYR